MSSQCSENTAKAIATQNDTTNLSGVTAIREDHVNTPREHLCILPDTTVIFATQGYLNHLCVQEIDLIGKPWLSILSPCDSGWVRESLSSVSPEQPLRRFEARSLTQNGSEVVHIWTARGVFDAAGCARSFQVVGRAVDEATTAPRNTDQVPCEFLENLLDAIGDDVFVKDDSHRWVVLNKAACQLIGSSRSELIGKTDTDVFPEEQALLHLATDQEVLRSEKIVSYEWSIERDGERRTYLAKKSPFIDSTSGTRYVAGVARDITDLKNAEAELFREKERALVTLHSIDNGVIRTDPQGYVEYMNPVAEALTGWISQEARDAPLSLVFHIVEEQSRAPLLSHSDAARPASDHCWPSCEALLIHRSGREYAVEHSGSPIRGTDGESLGTVIVFRDVTEKRRMARKLEHDAAHDALTGLVNRRQFELRLEKAVLNAKHFSSEHVLCYFDLDKFKLVNDTAGHVAGDELLKRVKSLLSGCFRDRDTFGRLGGDEFGLLLDNCPVEEALGIADIIVAKFQHFCFEWNGHSFQVGASVGVVPISVSTESATEALSQADLACYAAKELGGGQVHIYKKHAAKTSRRHSYFVLASDLQSALQRDAFCLYGQPIHKISTPESHPTQIEILLRLLDGNQILLPGEFIRPAERYGLMAAIDRWVINSTFAFLKENSEKNGALQCAVNISGNSLNDEDFLGFVDNAIFQHELSADRICFEITETAAIRNLHNTANLLRELKTRGFKLTLDDFGSGLSSFKYLKHLPVDYLKIDGSFVVDMAENSLDLHMVEAINEVGHVLGMQTIAECVENEAALGYLSDMNVDMAQGYALGGPFPLAKLAGEPMFAGR